MNKVLFYEDITNVIRSFYLCNNGDDATTNLVLAIGAELLDISSDKMLGMVIDEADNHCPNCGHHVNFDADSTGYCPICDKEVQNPKA